MKTWAVDEVMAENTCGAYTREKVEKIFGDKKTLATLEILKMDSIHAEDRIRIAMSPEALPDAILEKFAAQTADRAVRNHALHCGIPKVENWAQKWLSGEDKSAQTALAAAAKSVEVAAAARAAARAAWVCASARTADWAAWAAGEAGAAGEAEEAEEKERVTQVQDLIALIEGEKNENMDS